ncbi:MAG: thioredoxin-disulfide reductase [Bacillota bacterium]
MVYDLAIIGAGPTGLTAGIYAARARMKAVIIERGASGGKVLTADKIENYPGFPEPIPGAELVEKMESQTRRLGVEFKSLDVAGIRREGDRFILRTIQGDVEAKTIILATGSGPSPLGVPGEDRLRGKGVSYCAICDGFFFRDQKVAVIGGGDAAVHEALYLTRFVEKVYLIHKRDALRATKIIQEQLRADPKVEVLLNTDVKEILGENEVTGIKVQDTVTGNQRDIAVNGVFVYVGVKPASYLVKDLVDLDPRGYVVTDENMATKTPGLFAAGDVRVKSLRQIVTAVSDGAVAAVAADRFLRGRA